MQTTPTHKEALREFLGKSVQRYLQRPSGGIRKSPVDASQELNLDRANAAKQLQMTISYFLAGNMPVEDFKHYIHEENTGDYWQFKANKGEWYFNRLYNCGVLNSDFRDVLTTTITLPKDDDAAKRKIHEFDIYVRGLRDIYPRRGLSYRPDGFNLVPLFVSFFWQVQARELWPLYLPKTLLRLPYPCVWRPWNYQGDTYIGFMNTYREYRAIFSEAAACAFSIFDVECIISFIHRDKLPWVDSAPPIQAKPTPPAAPQIAPSRLPGGFVPPIVAVLPELAQRDATQEATAKAQGTSLDRVFEDHVQAAFTMLGFEAAPALQEQNRLAQGIAISSDDSYAILWDARVSKDGYSIGADDRILKDYFGGQIRELKKWRNLRHVYYVVVSSRFADNFRSTIEKLKMQTDVSDVILLQASALVSMVELRLKQPREVTLGPGGLQRLFTASGVVTGENVRRLFAQPGALRP